MSAPPAIPAPANATTAPRDDARPADAATTEPAVVKWTLIALAAVIMVAFIVLPLVVVFAEALGEGWAAYRDAIEKPETWDSIVLTLKVAAIAVPLNTLFGVAAAWLVSKYEFRGKSALTTLIDLPFSVSPVVAGMTFVLLFGAQGWFPGGHDYTVNLGFTSFTFYWPKVIFALPGIVLATIFITFPFVARELIPLMQAQGVEEEQAARVLGASGWQTFRRVTLPNIKWGLLYGVILCNARAMGEFGAVYVVSANYEGQFTLPLAVERAYYASFVSVVPAFALASLLAALAVVTLVVKSVVEWRAGKET